MVLGSLAFHLQMQHRKSSVSRWHWGTPFLSRDPCTYKMDFPTSRGPRNCPVKECWGRAATRTAIQVHFFHWHFRDTVIILEEGNLSHA